MTKGSLGGFRDVSSVRGVSVVRTVSAVSVVSVVRGVSTVRVIAAVWVALVSSFLRNPTNKRMKTEKIRRKKYIFKIFYSIFFLI